MMSKAEEKKVLEQIKELIESTGEDSYISMAFEGCVSDAEDNIEYDFGNSWKHRAEHYAELQDNAIREKIELGEIIKDLEEQIERTGKSEERHAKEHNDWIKAWNAQQLQINELTEKLQQAEAETVKLKLMLFEYMMKEKETA